MNLIHDPWLNVIMVSGERKALGLKDLFSSSQEIQDLDLSPVQRVSVMRLLICIFQSAIDGPSTEQEQCHLQPDRTIATILEYLDKWESAFELYGDQAFLQVDESSITDSQLKTHMLIDPKKTSDNSPVHRDHRHVDGGKHMQYSDAELAINLLTLMNFASCGTMSVLTFKGEKTPKSPKMAPARGCINGALHVFVYLENLFKTLQVNLVSKAMLDDNRAYGVSFGLPPWEYGTENFKDYHNTYLSNLVPISRIVKLKPEGLYLGGTDLNYEDSVVPSGIIVKSKEDKDIYLPVSIKKKPWRELTSLLSCNRIISRSTMMIHELKSEKVFIWAGGAEIREKVVNAGYVDSSFCIKSENFENIDYFIQRYSEVLVLAETYLNKVIKSIHAFYKCLTPDTDNPLSKTTVNNAATSFWSALNQKRESFLAYAQSQDSIDSIEKVISDIAYQILMENCDGHSGQRVLARAQAILSFKSTPKAIDKNKKV